jgi:RNA polymerase-interacting CarD/CdnL/TRCF family regulator
MIRSIGRKVVYPFHGPCRVGAVIKKDFGGRSTNYYPLAVMDDSGEVLFVPVDKFKTLGIRRLLEKSEIPKLLSQLSRKVEALTPPNAVVRWKQRAIDNSKLLASGSAFDLARIIASLTKLGGAKALSPRERHVLETARKHLICEISEVTGNSRSEVEEQIDNALRARKEDWKGRKEQN